VIALMFPGQGAQVVGMGQELAASSSAARAAFDEADEVLGYSLSEICFAGPAERLMQTDICQPALVATSIAAWRVAEESGLRGDLVMGHSLGEYSALVVAGAISYPDALRLVAERGAAMQAAADASPGAMAAVLGASDDEVQALCDDIGDVWPANFNCPGQVVVSGTRDGIDRLVARVAETGGKATRLQVSGAFHSPLVASAAERLSRALAAWTPGEITTPFLSTTTCRFEPADHLRDLLADQLVSPVRFGSAVEAALAAGTTQFIEIGVGRVLSGLVRRVQRDAAVMQITAPGDLASLAEVVR
jgi:[acyl-carrier-protein] S-malonyltransferase